MKYYLGIDGGGTKTTAAVADENGLLFKREGKTINFYSVGMQIARKNLSELICEIESELKINRFESVFIGCSALDGEADEELVKTLCSDVIDAEKIKINSDVYIALKAVGDAICPCVAICGTGSMAIAQDFSGNIHITGGWGHIIGDEGSAYAISLRALKLCCRQFDKGEDTPLLKSALKFFDVTDFRKVIDVIYSDKTTKDVIAAFATKVCELACGGDETSLKIIQTEAQKFADTVLILLKKVKVCSLLGLYGGVFENNRIFVEFFSEKIRESFPELSIKIIDVPPEESALNLARDL
ncbi:MAG: hypothetical protein IJZ88_03145 [Clostridia bacterium]|nr:hypothetical protein [Clostridia bacterium]